MWRARIDERDLAVRRSRRSPESLAWELDVIELLGDAGFNVAQVVETADGRRHVDGVVVQRWLRGVQPSTDDEWHRVVETLEAIHEVGRGYLQRPGCCTVRELAEKRKCADADLDQVPTDVEAMAVGIFASFAGESTSLIHGDPDESNLRVLEDGSIGLLDLDESRVDLSLLDLTNLGIQVGDDARHARGMQLSHAWEAVNGWVVEPDYAKRRYAQLLETF